MENKEQANGNNMPSFAKQRAYSFVTDHESLSVYRELSQIAEEIEACRRKNA